MSAPSEPGAASAALVSGWRWRSGLVRLTRAALVAEAVYLVVANALLFLPAFRRQLDPIRPGLVIRFEQAWTPLPGLFVVRDFDLLRDGPVRRWALHADRAWGFFDPAWLLARTLRFSHVRAEGVEIRVRARPPSDAEVDPEPERLLPPLGDLPGAPAAGSPPAHRRAWRVRIDSLAARGLREVWIDAVRFQGEATVRGGFTARPRESFRLFPSEIHVAAGSLRIGERRLASELAADLEGSGEDLALPVRLASTAWLAPLSIAGTVRAEGVEAAALEPLLPAGSPLRLAGGAGPIEARLRLESGTVAPGSALDWRPTLLAAEFLGYHAEGTARVTAGVDTDGDPLHLDVDFDHFRLGRIGSATAHLEGTELRASVSSRDRHLDGHLDGGFQAAVQLPEGRVADLRAYEAYFPERLGLSVLDGHAVVSARFTVADNGRGNGEIDLVTSDAALGWDSLEIRGRLRVAARLATDDVRSSRYSLAGTTVDLEEVSVARPPSPPRQQAWWARLTVPEGNLAPGAEEFLTADLEAELRDGEPLEELFRERRPLLGRLAAGLDTRGLAAQGRVRIGKSGTDLEGLEISYPRGDLQARLRFAGPERSGRLLARWRRFALGLEFRGEERNWIASEAEAWWRSLEGGLP